MMDKTLAEASEKTGIPITTLRKAVLRNEIPARKSGTFWLVDIDDPGFAEYLKKREKWLSDRGRLKR